MKREVFLLFLYVWSIGGACSCMAQQSEYALIFQVVNIKEKKGNLIVRLYDKIEAFEARGQGFVQEKRTPLSSSSSDRIFITFDSLSIGKYYAFFFQDINGNDKADMNRMKVPQEPYSYSRPEGSNLQENMTYDMLPEHAAFEYVGREIRMIIKLIK